MVDRIREYLSRNGFTAEPGKPNSIGYRELSKRMGAKPWDVRQALKAIRNDAGSTATEHAENTESHDIRGDSWVVTLPKTRIKTLEELLAHYKVDTTIWEVERWICNKWEVGAKDAAKHIQVEPLFQVKAWLKKKVSIAAIAHQVEEFQRKAENYAPKYPAIIFRDLKRSGNMVEVSIYDHHFGALIWGKETGHADYDTAIADAAFRDSLACLLSRSRGYGIDRILLTIGNDLQNSDNRTGTTEAGTPQANDSRYERVCGIVQDAAVWAIEACREVAPEVLVPIVRGNHDPMTTFHLGGYLTAWFRNCPGVTIDNSPLNRKAYQHGKVMLMLTHGKGIKTDEYLSLMATEHPRMWADTTWREAHTGHIHTRRNMVPQLDEIKGVAVRSLPSLRPPCAWSSELGYVGNIRSAEAFVWNRDEGLIGTAIYSPRDAGPRSQAKAEAA